MAESRDGIPSGISASVAQMACSRTLFTVAGNQVPEQVWEEPFFWMDRPDIFVGMPRWLMSSATRVRPPCPW